MRPDSINNFLDELFDDVAAKYRESDKREILEAANNLLTSILALSSVEVASLPDQIRDAAITLKNYVEDEKDEYEEKDKGKYCTNCGEYLSSKAKYCSRCGISQE